jgi:NADPH:quinone reductase-like Zn-dependent oxidoreductase
VGQYAIQIARLYSFTVFTTCSPKNFELVRNLGATHVFDYNAPDVADQIREVAPGLKYVFDTIGRGSTSTISSRAADADATLCTVRPGQENTENVPKSVKITAVLVWTAFLKDHRYGRFHWPVSIYFLFRTREFGEF